MFEPTYLQSVLTLPDNVGHIIFGKAAWVAMGGTLSDCQDPLSLYFNPPSPLAAFIAKAKGMTAFATQDRNHFTEIMGRYC